MDAGVRVTHSAEKQGLGPTLDGGALVPSESQHNHAGEVLLARVLAAGFRCQFGNFSNVCELVL